MDRLSLILPKVLNKRGLQTQVLASLVTLKCREWIAANMGKVASMLTVTSHSDGWLEIDAANAIALSECTQRQAEMLESLRAQLPEARILGVRIVRARG